MDLYFACGLLGPWSNHKALRKLNESLDLQHTFGFVKMVSFPQVTSAAGTDDASRTLLGTSEIKTGVPRSFSSDVGVVRIPQVISFDDVSSIGSVDQEVTISTDSR